MSKSDIKADHLEQAVLSPWPAALHQCFVGLHLTIMVLFYYSHSWSKFLNIFIYGE